MFSRISAVGYAVLALTASLCAEPRSLDVYVSTGDNHFLGSSLPIDSPASIAATFDLFKNVNRARRVYWRGLEEACWVSTMQARAENPRYHSLWRWMEWLYANVKPDQLAVKAAHARGMEIWGVGSLWDWGAPADTPTFGDYPFPFESKLKLEHPEWAPANRFGTRRQGGPIELAYPEARRALVELLVRETQLAGYDGITLLTYVENYALRYQDEFGFSEPIVRDFQRLHGIDLRREPFRRGATREDWLRLRGTYVTAFLRELRAALAPLGTKLGMMVNANDPQAPLSWNVPELLLTAGSHHLDLTTWIREGLVDALCIYGNTSRDAQEKAIRDVRFLARDTPCEISFMTSSPFAPAWADTIADGVPAILSVSDDAQHLARGFIPEQPTSALRDTDLWKRLRALQQIIDGSAKATVAELEPLTRSPELIERRMALEALGKTGDSPALRAALDDPENGVRCVAALALGHRRDPSAAPDLFRAVEKHSHHMLVECAVIALRKMQPLPVAVLVDAARKHPHPRVREIAVRTLQPLGLAESAPVFINAREDSERFVRYAAADGLGKIRRPSPEALEALLALLAHEDPTTRCRAALSLAEILQRGDAPTPEVRPRVLEALRARFIESAMADDGWTFRPLGNALRACGEDGVRMLRELRDGAGAPRPREAAWRVLDLPQQPGTFTVTSLEADQAAHARQPVAEGTRTTDLHVDPAQGSDANDGRSAPVKTLARAVRLAGPGDTVHLKPARYFEVLDLSLKSGEPGRPIVIDGHGAVLDGSDPLRAGEWEALGSGLFRKTRLLPRMDDAILGRWFFVWDGAMQRMGRTSKGPSAALKPVAELAVNEWTYVKEEDAFYVRVAGDSLDAAKIRAPIRSNGVILSGRGAHLVVRNLTATHFYNDGFNIHGAQRATEFANIAAVECGDDGFSAHEDADCRIDGFVSIGNSTGITDTVSSITHFRHVFIRDCLGYDLFFIGDSPHSVENALIESRAARAVEIAQHADRPQAGPGRVLFRNVLLQRTTAPQEIRVGPNAELTVEQCTFRGLKVQVSPGGAMTAVGSIFTGDPRPELVLLPNALWRGDGNVLDFASLTAGGVKVDAAAFQRSTRTDAKSVFGPDPLAGAGADEAALGALRQRAAEVERTLRRLP